MARKRVLITGAAGYLSRQLLPVLRERYDLVLLDRRKPPDIDDIIEVAALYGLRECVHGFVRRGERARARPATGRSTSGLGGRENHDDSHPKPVVYRKPHHCASYNLTDDGRRLRASCFCSAVRASLPHVRSDRSNSPKTRPISFRCARLRLSHCCYTLAIRRWSGRWRLRCPFPPG